MNPPQAGPGDATALSGPLAFPLPPFPPPAIDELLEEHARYLRDRQDILLSARVMRPQPLCLVTSCS